jgi:hypothetical protein
MYSIKFNHIQDLGDARYASAVLSDYIGFSLDGEFAISPQTVQEIIGWCAGPKIILEINTTPNLQQIESWLNILPIDGIQCNEEDAITLKSHFKDVSTWITFNDFKSVPTSPESAEEILQNGLNMFSINCFKETTTGIKDYSEWNDFFEKLEIF